MDNSATDKNSITLFNSSNITCTHGFFTRNGGVSAGLFGSLSCGTHKGDTAENVRENRRRVAEHFSMSPNQLCLAVQVHSNRVHIIDNVDSFKNNSLPECDALITRLDDVILGVLTADCGPIVLHDPVQHIIASVHAGWRGAVSGILENTVNQFVKFGSNVADIEAAIGPCLWKAHFAVKDDFIQEARGHLNGALDEYLDIEDGETLFDLPKLLFDKLNVCGLSNITPSIMDTYSHEDMFFSYRRKTHKIEEHMGLQISCIMQKN